MKTHHWIILVLAIVLIGILALWPKPTVEKLNDELTGSWRGGGVNAEGFEWFMLYDFDNGKYSLETGTNYSEDGVYRIKERFEDGSMIVEKTFDDGKKVYEMTIVTGDDPDIITLEGMRLERQ